MWLYPVTDVKDSTHFNVHLCNDYLHRVLIDYQLMYNVNVDLDEMSAVSTATRSISLSFIILARMSSDLIYLVYFFFTERQCLFFQTTGKSKISKKCIRVIYQTVKL